MRVSEAAEALGVHPNTVRNWLAAGRLRDVRPVGAPHARLDAAQVASMVADQVQVADPEVEADVATFHLTVPAHVRHFVIRIDRGDP